MLVQDLQKVEAIWSRFVIEHVFASYPKSVDLDASIVLRETSTRPHADFTTFFRDVVGRLSASGILTYEDFDGFSLFKAKLTEQVLDRMDPDGSRRSEKARVARSSTENDELYAQAIEMVLSGGRASSPYLHRFMGVSYSMASALIKRMEDDGIISGGNDIGKREVLVSRQDALTISARKAITAN